MKISQIEFENFRNFKDHGVIRCSTDGKITIIYGKNGDGKTTLHQLFQWVFYGKYHFNRTATDHLYNLDFESEQHFGSAFKVMGRIDFENENDQYSLTRINSYKKDIDDSQLVKQELYPNKMDDDNNWKRIDSPEQVIEKLLPSGLSEYFFFDGESMIADLRVKGRDSAEKLRTALYSMFDLDILESAIEHIGRTDLKTTVLGKLYLNKGTVSSEPEISDAKNNVINAQNQVAKYKADLDKENEEKQQLETLIKEISEKIGSQKSKEEYEREREKLKDDRDTFIDNAKSEQEEFGDLIVSNYPQLFVSKAVNEAKKKIHLKIEDNKLPEGLGKKLINYLASDKTNQCICGRELGPIQKDHIREYLDMLPPNSYANLYNEFTKIIKIYGRGYDKDKLDKFIKSVIKNNERAEECDKKIRTLDDKEKKSPEIEDLVVNRGKADERLKTVEDSIIKTGFDEKKYEIYLKKVSREYDELTKSTKEGTIVIKKIELMEKVEEYFDSELTTESDKYSKQLELNIQNLFNEISTTKRTVAVSSDFAVKITDSFNDESKSEGQFAIVSFAYIGGILKMLKDMQKISAKEYPLVLDGPFSKLDSDQKHNVLEVLPSFAPQVIIFSKDDLQAEIKPENIGRVWTLQSNGEKNIATVKEGYLWK